MDPPSSQQDDTQPATSAPTAAFMWIVGLPWLLLLPAVALGRMYEDGKLAANWLIMVYAAAFIVMVSACLVDGLWRKRGKSRRGRTGFLRTLSLRVGVAAADVVLAFATSLLLVLSGTS